MRFKSCFPALYMLTINSVSLSIPVDPIGLLLVISYQLSVISYQLLVISYWLLVIGSQLFVIGHKKMIPSLISSL